MVQEIWLKTDIIENGILRAEIDTVYNETVRKLHETYPDSFPLLDGAKIKTDNVFYLGFCKMLAEALQERLKKFGLKSEIIGYQPKSKNEKGHYFIVFKIKGIEWLIDMTWQQFLPDKDKPNNKLPKVLLAKVADIELALGELGMPAKKMKIWTVPLQKHDASKLD